MAKNYVLNKHSPIIYNLNKNRLRKIDLCRALNIREITLNDYIENPDKIRLGDLRLMAGVFGINVLHLVYCLERNKPQTKKEDKWYIESVVNKHPDE